MPTEAAAAAIVQKLTLTREQIEAETKRIANETQAHEQRRAQAQNDRQREQERKADGKGRHGRQAYNSCGPAEPADADLPAEKEADQIADVQREPGCEPVRPEAPEPCAHRRDDDQQGQSSQPIAVYRRREGEPCP